LRGKEREEDKRGRRKRERERRKRERGRKERGVEVEADDNVAVEGKQKTNPSFPF